ncbi:MAG: zf-HC2 domain-containing protein [Gemmatimonadota bacterium]
MDARHTHLSPEHIQAFLEEDLPPQEQAGVEAHVRGCSGCRDQVESWREFLAQLNGLPTVAPSAAFSRSVLDRLELEPELDAATAPSASDHPAWEVLQEWADGVLPRRLRVRVDRHVQACPSCSRESARWKELFAAVNAVPVLAPTSDFSEGVLARVRSASTRAQEAQSPQDQVVTAPAPVRGPRVAVPDWIRSLRPRSRRGWMVAGGAIAAPGVALATLAALVASHPLVSMGDLAAFLWIQTTGAVSAVASQMAGGMLESMAVFWAYTLASGVVSAPLQFAAIALAGVGITGWAAWIFHRNLTLPSLPSLVGSYARSS